MAGENKHGSPTNAKQKHKQTSPFADSFIITIVIAEILIICTSLLTFIVKVIVTIIIEI